MIRQILLMLPLLAMPTLSSADVLSDLKADFEDNQPQLDDPFPKVIKMGAPFVTHTIGYWAGGAMSQTKTCFEIPDMADYRQVTTTTKKRVPGRGTCQVAPMCDGHNEFCEDVSVVVGCWVRNDIYRWFRGQVGGGDLDDAQKDLLCNKLFE